MNIRKDFIIAALMFCCGTSAFAQRLNMRLRNVSVAKVMVELKKQTGYTFVYESGDLDRTRKVSISATTLNDAIKQMLEGQNVTYEIYIGVE